MKFRFHPAAVWGGLLLLFLSYPAAATDISETAGTPSPLIGSYRQALQVDPDNLPLHYFLGVALLSENHPEEAIAEFRRAYPDFTDSTEMNYNLGLAYYRVGDPDNAVLYLEQSEALGALDQPALYPLADLYFNLGLAYLETDNHPEAIRTLRKVHSLDPNRHEIHRLLGDIFSRNGQIDKALAEFGLFLQAYPEDAAAREYVYTLYFNRAQQFLEDNEPAAARKALEEALNVAPDSPLARYYLGFIDYSEGRLEGAVEHLSSCYGAASDEVRRSAAAMLYNSALGLLEQGKAHRALAAIAPLTSEQDPGAKYLYLAGNIHLGLKEYNRARLLYRRVLKIDPAHRGATVNLVAAETGSVNELYERGRALFRRGDYLDALQVLETVLAINPSEARARAYADEIRSTLQQKADLAFAAAEAEQADGRLREALAQVREGLKLVPGSRRGTTIEKDLLDELDRQIAQMLTEGDTLLQENRLQDAARTFDRVLSLSPDHRAALAGKKRIAARLQDKALRAVEAGNQALAEGRLADARKAFADSLGLAPDLAAAAEGLARADALISNRVTESLQWGRRAKAGGDLQQARKHFGDALLLRDTPAIREEVADLDRILTGRVASLRAATEQALNQGHFKQARSRLAQLLQLAPDDSEALAMEVRIARRQSDALGQRLAEAGRQLESGELRQAMASYRRVIDLAPDSRAAKEGLRKGQSMLAEKLKGLAARGEAALAAGQWDEAEAAFDQALALDPYQATALAGRDRLDRLRQTGDKPGDQDGIYLQGIELYTRGRYEEAIAAWQRVLALAPGHERARLNIDKAQRKLKQIKVYRDG